MTEQSGPLAGIKVLDFSQLIAGPSCGVMLSDLGAEVTKVERLGGEMTRYIGAFDGVVPPFVAYNRGKRSLPVDLSSEDGIAVVHRLVGEADVLIEGFRPGVMTRLGLGPDACRARDPRLVYASVSGFHGDAELRGVDAVIQAASGVMALTGDPDAAPMKVGFQFIDAATGIALCQAIMTALFHRERTGQGSALHTSLFEVSAFMQSPAFVQTSMTGSAPARAGNSTTVGYPTDLFETADGGYVMVAAYFPEQFVALCDVIGTPALAEDPRFLTNQDRLVNRLALKPLLAERFRTRSRDEWVRDLAAADVISSPVREHHEILGDPAIRGLGNFVEARTENGDQRWFPQIPFSSSAWSSVPEWNPPALGAHTYQVLRDAGLLDEEIDALVSRGVVAVAEDLSVAASS